MFVIQSCPGRNDTSWIYTDSSLFLYCLYLSCLRTVFVPFVIRAFCIQARKIIFLSANQNYYLLIQLLSCIYNRVKIKNIKTKFIKRVSDSIALICNTLSFWGLITKCLYNIFLNSRTRLSRVNLQRSFWFHCVDL